MYVQAWDRNHAEIKTDTDIVLLFIESHGTLWRKFSSQLYCYYMQWSNIYLNTTRSIKYNRYVKLGYMFK